ncbi:MAG: ATP-binding cassette domain-containing protein, partial [Candidatus Dormibacteria bacterium]
TMAATAAMLAVLRALEVLVPGVFLVAVTWLGVGLAESHHFAAGQLVTVYAFAASLIVPLAIFGETAQQWSAGRVAAGRVISVLRLERDLPTLPEPVALEAPVAGLALFDSLSGLRVEPGRLTAVTGEDLAALSQLADRLGRYSDPPAGEEVLIGRQRLADLPLSLVRRAVVVVDREARLLAGRLSDGLDLPPAEGPGTRRPSLAACLRAADATEILSGLPGGLDYVIPERGRTLSGGQRQRLVLARALRTNPPVLVLDQPTSAVDTHTEASIVERLAQLRAGRTTVVVTSSPLMLERAERVVLIEGRVLAEGTHAELMAREPRYRAQLAREAGQ